MSNKKQSSVDWLWAELRDKFNWETGEMYNSDELVLTQILEQAKAIHKEEIKDAYEQGDADAYWELKEKEPRIFKDKKDYYNETFNNDGNPNN